MEKLIPLVYQELRRLAAYHMQQERSGHTLQATALVHEVYLRLAGSEKLDLRNRAHFFAVAAQVMRNLLVDHARARNCAKRGGGATLPLDEALTLAAADSEELLAIHDALDELARMDPRQSRIVELKYFGGMSIEEIAAVLDLSERTVKREWQMAKAWLYERVSGGSSS
jgi:RNA polymerase sigma factor (TIGR02999 family)